jgi:predicted aspartyl protease
MLGDGSIVPCNVYQVGIMWNDEVTTVEAQEAEVDPLLGMALLEGYHLGVDVREGGSVSIEPLA